MAALQRVLASLGLVDGPHRGLSYWSDDIEALMQKAKRLIDTADEKHKPTVTRWITLMNMRLHAQPCTGQILGGSMGLYNRYTSKFGRFVPRGEPVRSEHGID